MDKINESQSTIPEYPNDERKAQNVAKPKEYLPGISPQSNDYFTPWISILVQSVKLLEQLLEAKGIETNLAPKTLLGYRGVEQITAWLLD